MTDSKPPISPEQKSKPEAMPEAKPEAKPEDKPEAKPKRSRGSLRSKARWAKRIVIIVLLVLLVLLLLNWQYCQKGRGSGGIKTGDGGQNKGVTSQMTSRLAPKAPRTTCRLRVDSKGVSHKGKTVTIPAAVKACRGAKRAALTVTGDATFGTVKKLGQALRAASIAVVRR